MALATGIHPLQICVFFELLSKLNGKKKRRTSHQIYSVNFFLDLQIQITASVPVHTLICKLHCDLQNHLGKMN